MIKIFTPVIDQEILKFARQIAKKRETDVLVESHDKYVEVHYEVEKK